MHTIGDKRKMLFQKKYVEMFYLILFSISLISSFIINTTFMQYFPVKLFNRINYAVIFFLALKVYVFDKFNYKQLFLITGFFMVAIVSWKKTGIISVMIMIMFILSAKDIDFRKIIQCYFNVNLILILSVTLYSLLGIIRNLIYFRDNTARYSLGVNYPTDYAAYIFYLILAYVFLNYNKLKIVHYLAFIIIALVVYCLTNARLNTIAILLVIPIICIAKLAERKKYVFNLIAVTYWEWTLILPYFFFLLTYYFSWGNRFFMKINTILSGRLAYGHIAIGKYSIPILSQHIHEQGWGGINGFRAFKHSQGSYFFIDSSFIRLLVVYGLIITIFFVVVMLTISIRGTLSHKYLIAALILLITISSLVDQHLLEITFNPFLTAFLAKSINYKKQGVSISNVEEHI